MRIAFLTPANPKALILSGFGACLMFAAQPAAAGEAVLLPSKQKVLLYEVIVEAGEAADTYRLRFLKLGITGADLLAEMQVNEADMAYLCQTYALPAIADAGGAVERIVISFSDKPTEFGVASPDAVQVFESYWVESGTCEWEEF